MDIGLDNLNDNQKEAVVSNDGPLVVLSSAGSGKTRVLTTKIAYLLEEVKVRPNRIFAVTFTKKAAEEMQGRLTKLVGDKAGLVRMSTIHSLAFKIYREGKKRVEPWFEPPKPLVHEGRVLGSLFKFCKDKNLINRDARVYLDHIAKLKMQLIMPEDLKKDVQANNPNLNWSDTRNLSYDAALYLVYVEYETWKAKRNKLDFNDMLVYCYHLLIDPKYKDYVEALSSRVEYMLVDECQDTNVISFRILKIIADQFKNITLVGDLRQCQPKGTLITLEGNIQKPIEKIKKGDRVVSWRQDKSYYVGTKAQARIVTDICKREFSGNLFTIRCKNKQTRSTPTHKFIARFSVNKKMDNHYVVYVMERNKRFRIGWCKLFEKSGGNNHFFRRCRLEKANGWIIKVCRSKEDASYFESLYAAQYGIPMVMFHQVPNNRIYTQKFLNKLHNEAIFSYKNGLHLLKQFGRELHYPYFNYLETIGKQRGRQTIFKIQACNLLPKIMSIPSYEGDKNTNWEIIRGVSYHHTKCNVYSLDVETNHNYVADGLTTCNSIYSFQHARIENIKEFIAEYNPKIVNLTINYRSTQHIVENSNKLIGYSRDLIAEPATTPNEKGKPLSLISSGCSIAEGEAIYDLIRNMNEIEKIDWRDITVLYRVHSQARELEDWFLMQDIPYISFAKTTFYKRKEIMDLMAYLQLALNPYKAKIADLKRIANKPTRYITNASLEKLDDYADDIDVSPFEILKAVWEQDFHGTEAERLDTLAYDIERIHKFADGKTPAEIFRFALDTIGYKKWAIDDNKGKGDVDDDIEINFESLISSVQKFPTPGAFYEFIRELKKKEKLEKDPNGNFVKMMSIHASKGKEFKNVIVLGVCDRLYPFYKAVQEGNSEEERRVMYVAITRPEEKLYISAIHDTYGHFKVRPSPYIGQMNIDPAYTTYHDSAIVDFKGA